MGKEWWPFALRYCVYTLNRITNHSKRNEANLSPYEVITGSAPNVNHFRPFGCFAVAWIHRQEDGHSKLDPSGDDCRFLGYSDRTKGYVLLRLSDFKIIVRRAVRFYENIFDYKLPSPSEHYISDQDMNNLPNDEFDITNLFELKSYMNEETNTPFGLQEEVINSKLLDQKGVEVPPKIINNTGINKYSVFTIVQESLLSNEFIYSLLSERTNETETIHGSKSKRKLDINNSNLNDHENQEKQNNSNEFRRNLRPDYGSYQLKDHYIQQIFQHFGIPDCDMFADGVNKQAKKFICSPLLKEMYKNHPDCVGVDAFSINWNQFELPFVNPPYHLIPEVMKKFENEFEINKELIMVVPFMANLHKSMEAISTQQPLLINNSEPVFTGYNINTPPPKWPIAIYKISNSKSGQAIETYSEYKTLLPVSVHSYQAPIIPLSAFIPSTVKSDDIDEIPPGFGNSSEIINMSAKVFKSPTQFVMNLVLDEQVPNSYKQALKSPEFAGWKIAMDKEIASQVENRTWYKINRDQIPKGTTILGSRWVFTKKRSAAYTIERGLKFLYKARLVAQGYKQVAGIDYTEVYAPVVGHKSIRILLSRAASRKMNIHTMDVSTAFLNGVNPELSFMEVPDGLEVFIISVICVALAGNFIVMAHQYM